MKLFSHTLNRIGVDSTISHFLLMFGYKLFSSYFALFLLDKGLSIANIGYAYFLISASLALFSPVIGFLAHKANLAVLSSVGILGYGVYSLGMYLSPPEYFYLFQVILGMSAASFFVSTRILLIRASLDNYDFAFGWFNSAPIYAELLAPAVGGTIIYFFGFPGVFLTSFAIYLINISFHIHTLFESSVNHRKQGIGLRQVAGNYLAIVKETATKGLWPIITLGIAIMLVEGFYSAFLLLFLKSLGFSQNDIILYVSLWSLTFVPLSLLIIKILDRSVGAKNIVGGGMVYSLATVAMGYVAPVFNFYGILGINLIKSFGGFLSSAGRSGIMSRSFPKFPEEAGALDMFIFPLSVAFGSFIGGFLANRFGYANIFIAAGIFILIASTLTALHARRIKLS